MAAKRRKRKSSKRRRKSGRRSSMVCPKTFQGKRVRSSKGRCFIQVPVGKIPRKSATARRCVTKRYNELRRKGAPAGVALREAKKGCG